MDPIDISGGQRSNVYATMGIIDKCRVRGVATPYVPECVRACARHAFTLWTIGNLTVLCLFIKISRHVHYEKRMDPIDFEGQRPKITIDIYGNKLVKNIDTKPLCASSSNLADMLTMVSGWTLLILEVTGQMCTPRWASSTNKGCAGMLRFALLYLKYDVPLLRLRTINDIQVVILQMWW